MLQLLVVHKPCEVCLPLQVCTLPTSPFPNPSKAARKCNRTRVRRDSGVHWVPLANAMEHLNTPVRMCACVRVRPQCFWDFRRTQFSLYYYYFFSSLLHCCHLPAENGSRRNAPANGKKACENLSTWPQHPCYSPKAFFFLLFCLWKILKELKGWRKRSLKTEDVNWCSINFFPLVFS